MKTFKDIIKEATTEINQLPRRTKAFVDKHVVQKTDYPVDAEDQFTAKKVKKDHTKLASFKDGEDAAVYEEASMTPTDMKQRETIVKGMKGNAQDFKDRYGSKWKSVMYATATKAAMKEETDDEHFEKQSKKMQDAINLHMRKGKSYKDAAGAAKVHVKEEAEQIDELSATTLSKYSIKAARQGDDRLAGQKMADEKIRKQQGKSSTAKMAAEEVDLDEAFKAGAMKLDDGSSVTLTKESANSLYNLFNQLSSPNKTKMEQRLMSGSKGFNEILAFAKEV